jgi:hypothetical protein
MKTVKECSIGGIVPCVARKIKITQSHGRITDRQTNLSDRIPVSLDGTFSKCMSCSVENVALQRHVT